MDGIKYLDKEGLAYLWGKIAALSQGGDQAVIGEVAELLEGKSDRSHTHPVDASLSTTSANPVENRAVARAINGIRQEEDSPIPISWIEGLD